jgi:hypothetical protein
MRSPVVVDLFVEDNAHEELLRPLVERVASEEQLSVAVHVRSARGGHGRALAEFDLYQRLSEKGLRSGPLPDLIVVGIDGNCTSASAKRKEISEATRSLFGGKVISACPDPHVERWYLVDPDSFFTVVGHRPSVGTVKCARGHYKKLLTEAVRSGGHVPTLGGIEFAREIAAGLDFFRAGKNDASFKLFVDDLRAQMRARRSSQASGSP